ncbi:MAG: iron chelate uptake ABC transporter family permease subunit, partial [Nocardioidaceae bacterium]|nr:iron chelate uptake ABC transporter family permease subunit [Nocardioidaceae bacterium]
DTGLRRWSIAAVLQSLTRNDLADPYLLGISSGAAVGAVTVIVLGVSFAGFVGWAAVPLAGFCGAWGALVLGLAIASTRHGDLPPARTVLAGVAGAYIGSSYASLLTIMEGDGHAAKRVLAWTLGSAAGLRWGSATFLAIVALAALLVFMLIGPHLDAFAFGEDAARSLGIRVQRVRWSLFLSAALMTAAMVAFAGAIGFVGLVVPHLVRGVVGPGHRALLPLAALTGAVLLLWADTLARGLVQGQEIPLGVVTAVVGTPFFVWLLRRQRENA